MFSVPNRYPVRVNEHSFRSVYLVKEDSQSEKQMQATWLEICEGLHMVCSPFTEFDVWSDLRGPFKILVPTFAPSVLHIPSHD